MLGKLEKGDLVFTSDDEYAEGISVTEVLKLNGEVILVRGIDKNDELQAVTPKEIVSYEYMDTNGDIYHESMKSLEKQLADKAINSFSKEVAKELTGTTSPTGSLRYNTGKPEMSNIPPEFLLEMAEVMGMGARKYGKSNWRLGNNMSVPYDSAMRHIFAFINGESKDSESSRHHLAHAAVNLMFMYMYEKEHPELDDRDKIR